MRLMRAERDNTCRGCGQNVGHLTGCAVAIDTGQQAGIPPAMHSRWHARDGRNMEVIYVQPKAVGNDKPYATLRVLNATGRMRRYTEMGLENFSNDTVSAFLSPLVEQA